MSDIDGTAVAGMDDQTPVLPITSPVRNALIEAPILRTLLRLVQAQPRSATNLAWT
jgi:hypothetical protein